MSEEQKDDGLISVYVDGEEVRCKPGTNLVDLVASVGQEILGVKLTPPSNPQVPF